MIGRGRDCKSLRAVTLEWMRWATTAIGRTAVPTSLGSTPLRYVRENEWGLVKRVIAAGKWLMSGIQRPQTTRLFWYGQWANGGEGLKNGYLGLKFLLNGKVHYGWARVSLTVKNNWFNTATLTGYAFETIPNKSIIIGKTQGPDVIVEPATLGHLAAGANARSPWHIRGTAPDGETDVSPNGH